MNPLIQPPGTREDLPRWGMRGMEDLSVEALVQLHQKLEGWIGQRAHDPERTRRRPWVMPRKTAYPA
jgi:hypothetical protein